MTVQTGVQLDIISTKLVLEYINAALPNPILHVKTTDSGVILKSISLHVTEARFEDKEDVHRSTRQQITPDAKKCRAVRNFGKLK
jgi:hypothetical protein